MPITLDEWDTPQWLPEPTTPDSLFRIPKLESRKQAPTVYLNNEKRCTRCQNYYPATHDFFGLCAKAVDKMNVRCYACVTQQQAEYRAGQPKKNRPPRRCLNPKPPKGFENHAIDAPWGLTTLKAYAEKVGVPPSVLWWASQRHEDLILAAAKYRGISHEQLQRDTTPTQPRYSKPVVGETAAPGPPSHHPRAVPPCVAGRPDEP